MKRQRVTNEISVANSETHNSTVKPRSFFKLILSPTSQSNKLRIPEKFARAYHDELCTHTNVILTVPTGETWNVTLIKEDNKLWFHEGWHNFVDYYSIDYGYFLLFKYEGNKRFNVHVFDLTTCEISYQCSSSSPEENEPCHEDLGQEVDAPCKREIDDGDDKNDDSDFECLGSQFSSPDDYSDAQVIELDDEDYNDDHVGGEEEVKSHDGGSETLVARQGTSSRVSLV